MTLLHLTCEACGTPFERDFHGGHPVKYCSTKCNRKMHHHIKTVKTRGVFGWRACVDCSKVIIAAGRCYDCARPGARSLAPAKWLFAKSRKFGNA